MPQPMTVHCTMHIRDCGQPRQCNNSVPTVFTLRAALQIWQQSCSGCESAFCRWRSVWRTALTSDQGLLGMPCQTFSRQVEAQ
jgi:hypothetical protein